MGGSGAAGGSDGITCVEASECPEPQFQCQEAACVEGLCETQNVDDLEQVFCTVPATDAPGRCQNGICIAIGGVGG
jgi:hypothetical protein